MTSLAAEPLAEHDDNMGATAAREAAEALTEAAHRVAALAETGSYPLLAAALVRLTEATVAAEHLYDRQLSAAVIRQAGWNDCLASRRGLRAV